MLKSKDMTKGTIIEITNAPVSNMAGSTFGGAFGGPVLGAPIGHEMLKLSPNLASSNYMLSATQVQMLTGEQYELTAPVGKYGSSQGIAALIARLKQVVGVWEFKKNDLVLVWRSA